jgi:glycopeptide antibiotics resistance protein
MFLAVVGSPSVLLTTVVAAFLFSTIGVYFARRNSVWQWLFTVAAAVSLAGIVGFTWVPDGGWSPLMFASFDPSRLVNEFGQTLPWALGNWKTGQDGPLNLVLYIPAGFFVTLAMARGPWRTLAVVLSLAGLSLATEVMQALFGTRTGSLADVGSNSFGAILGVTAAVALLRAVQAGREIIRRRRIRRIYQN